jgi:excisionase family DNA binding protein
MRREGTGAREILTVEQVAEYLQLNKLTVYKYVREGKIPATKVGRLLRIARSDLMRFLDTQRVVPAAPLKATVSHTSGHRSESVKANRPLSRDSKEISVGPQRREERPRRDAVVGGNPLDWVIRGLH